MAGPTTAEELMQAELAVAREHAFRRLLHHRPPPPFSDESQPPPPNPPPLISDAIQFDPRSLQETLDVVLSERVASRTRLRETAERVRDYSASPAADRAECEVMNVGIAVQRELACRERLGMPGVLATASELSGDDVGGMVRQPVFEPMRKQSALAAGYTAYQLFTSPFLMDGRSKEQSSDRQRILPLLHTCFRTRDELIEYVRDLAVTEGYIIGIKMSKKEKLVVLGCDRGGVARSRINPNVKNPRKRNRRSRLINCPFEVVGKKTNDGLWKLMVKNVKHNHEPMKDIMSDPLVSRFSEGEILLIKNMRSSCVEPRQILAALKQRNPKSKATLRDIYAVRAKLRQKHLSVTGTSLQEHIICQEVQSSDVGERSTPQLYTPLLVTNLHKQGGPLEHCEVLQSSIKCFRSREELLEHVRSISMNLGYVISIQMSKRDKMVVIGCDRGGTYRSNRPDRNHQKRSKSRCINCPFKVVGKRKNDGLWIMKIENGHHNHEASKDMTDHPYARRCSEEELLRIKEMTFAGMQPRDILAALKQSNPDLKLLLRDLYNIKAKIRREFLSGHNTVQALIDELSKGGFQYNLRYDEAGNLSHLFFVHPHSVTLSKCFQNVFILNGASKASKFQMPLLDIAGVTCFNTCFHSCFALTRNTEVEDYIWVLRMLESVLGGNVQPRAIVFDGELNLKTAIQVVFQESSVILCTRHVEKNILLNCKTYFTVDDDWEKFVSAWTRLVDSPTELSYYRAWEVIQSEFKESDAALAYLANTWLPLKSHFVKAWTDRYLHFGNHVTSRADDTHSKLKKCLQEPIADVHSKLCLAIKKQIKAVKTQVYEERIRVSPKLRIPFFDKLRGHVSVFALRELHQQYKLALDLISLPVCTNEFSTTMGLPCAHKMKHRINESKGLYLTDIHFQWRIDASEFDNMDVEINNEAQMNKTLNNFDDQDDEVGAHLEATSLTTPTQFDVQCWREQRSLPEHDLTASVTSQDSPLKQVLDVINRTTKCATCKVIGNNSKTCQQTAIATVSGSYDSFFSVHDTSLRTSQDLNILPDGSHATVAIGRKSVLQN